MANNSNLPNIISTLTDGNLDTARVVNLGDSILIFGTSARGPVNNPIRCANPQEAASVFGSISLGNLVRGFSEAYYGPNGIKDIRLCRISNGKKAKLELTEESSSDTEKYPTQESGEDITALTVEALESGDIYNSVSFRQDIVDGQLSVIGYNPISGLETVIAYDSTGLKSGSVSDVIGLANAINLDPNLSRIVGATANEIQVEYELALTNDMVASGVIAEDESGILTLDLGEALNLADVNDDGITDDTSIISPSGIQVTAGNRLIRLNDIYELADINAELDSAGYTQVTLPYPVQTSGGVPTVFLDVDDKTVSGDGKARHKVVNSYIGTGDGVATVFEFTAYEAIDQDGYGDWEALKVYRTSAAGTTVEITAYTLDSVGGSANDYKAQITFTEALADGSIITVSYVSDSFTLTKSASLVACKASNSYRTYFVAGDKVTFGTAQPTDILIAYKDKKIYSMDVDVIVSNAKEGKLQFPNADKQPNVSISQSAVLGFDYDYQPEWINLSGAQSLQGGTNGIIMNNATKYNLLKDAYETLADYVADCILVMGTYLDDTKIVYDEETGLPVEVNAGFAQQLEDYLESLQDGVNETYGVMAVRPAASPKVEDVNDWYEKLTVESTFNKTRAANVMKVLDAKHLNIVAFEPVIANQSVPFPYVTTGEAVYAGLACKLPITSATTNKQLGSQIVACRYKLSPRQLDKLTTLRYVSSRLTPDGVWVVTDGVTAAAVGSDYTRFTTVKIVFRAMDIVRSKGNPFIGELFNPAKRAALETAINNGLLAMQEDGALKKYDFKINQTPQERALGIATIPLILWPEFELRRIEVEVKLQNI